MLRKFFLFFFFVFILTLNSRAADDFKIAVIDFKEFMDHSKIGETIQKEIQGKGEQLKTEFEKIQAELQSLQERYKREAPLWSREKKEEEERSFRIKINDFNNIKSTKEKEFADFRSKKVNEARESIIKYAEQRAKGKGYYLIIEKQSGSILYAHGSINITNDIIQDIDASPNPR